MRSCRSAMDASTCGEAMMTRTPSACMAASASRVCASSRAPSSTPGMTWLWKSTTRASLPVFVSGSTYVRLHRRECGGGQRRGAEERDVLRELRVVVECVVRDRDHRPREDAADRRQRKLPHARVLKPSDTQDAAEPGQEIGRA